jgi:hypothetical protein
MPLIEIEVNNDAARKWELASHHKKEKIVALLNNALELIEESLSSELPLGYGLPDENKIKAFEKWAHENKETYIISLKKARIEAANKGLTQKILDNLLDD